jgi:hypothetical protein
MLAHTRDNCLICSLTDEECRQAIRRWTITRTENDWERARSVAKRWTATREKHQRTVQLLVNTQ